MNMNKLGWKVLVLAVATATGGTVAAHAQYRPNRTERVVQDRDHDGDRDRNDNDNANRNQNNNIYQQGMRQGRWDAEHNQRARQRRWNNRQDQQSYNAGYSQGYRDAISSNRNYRRDNDDDDRARNNGRYGNNNGRWGSGQYGRWGQGRGGQNGRYGRYGQNGRFGTYGQNGHYGNFAGTAQNFGYQDGLNDGLKDRRTGHSFRPTEGDNYKHASRGFNSSLGSKDQYKQFYRQAYAEGYQRGYYGNGGGFYGR